MRLLSGFSAPLAFFVFAISLGIVTQNEASAQAPACSARCKTGQAKGLCCKTGLSLIDQNRCKNTGCRCDFEPGEFNVTMVQPIPSATATPDQFSGEPSVNPDNEYAANLFHKVQSENYNKIKGALDSITGHDSSSLIKKFESSAYHFSLNDMAESTVEQLKARLSRDIASISPSAIQSTFAPVGGSIQDPVASGDALGQYLNPSQINLRNLGGAKVQDWDGRTYRARKGVDIKVVPAWSNDLALGISLGARRVVAAVIDDGFDLKDSEYRANLYTNLKEVPCNGKDDDSNGFIDDYQGWDSVLGHGCVTQGALKPTVEEGARQGHGDHVASILAATIPTRDRAAAIGVAPGVSILPIKAYDPELGGYDSETLMKAYQYLGVLKRQGVNIVVVNTSYTAPCEFLGKAEQESLEALVTAGITVVGAAGNSGTRNDDTPMCPGNLGSDSRNRLGVQGVLSVANAAPGSEESDNRGRVRLAPYSNFGDSVNTAAPGTVVLANKEYRSGTSMATPHVSGVVALMYSVNPFITPADVERILSLSLGTTWHGYLVRSLGMINAEKAVKHAASLVVAGRVTNAAVGVQGAIVTMITSKAGAEPLKAKTDSSGTFFFRRPPVGTTLEVQVQSKGIYYPSRRDDNERLLVPPRLYFDQAEVVEPKIRGRGDDSRRRRELD